MSLSAMRDWCVRSARGGALMGLAMALGLGGAQAAAGPVPDYGHDFVVIGDPGNRAVNQEEGPWFYPPYAPEGFSAGQVNYRYRMARTEVTVGQWLEFVNAYAPYYEGFANALEFTGDWIIFDNSTGQYRAFAGSENFATNMGWRYAARYCNWLHNGKSLDQPAFENGAYDTSTFGRNPDGTFTDQPAHHADAKFWIPTLDEWIKGMHWDPAKNDGEGGYWRYPHSSDEAPVPGAPGLGDTNTGLWQGYDVGSYPHAASPWGLLDGSGGESEWLESFYGDPLGRFVDGSSWLGGAFHDEVDRFSNSSPWYGAAGLRLAGVIPGPYSGAALVTGLLMVSHRRRR
ncbi:MAG: SUMF1/EgtB/PvdO family nonheme iron enzyme [Phycisphaerales bacterium]|nr:SUMF1/EgtB/PvdO family nonheme iron enzyme [Phycisphaerales bacterium]